MRSIGWYPKATESKRVSRNDWGLTTQKVIWCQLDLLMDLGCWIPITYHFKWIKKTHVTLSSLPPFIVTIMTIVKYSRSLISRPNLFYDGKYLVATTFETSVQLIFKDLGWIFKLSYNKFYFFFRLNQKQNVQKLDPFFFQLFSLVP